MSLDLFGHAVIFLIDLRSQKIYKYNGQPFSLFTVKTIGRHRSSFVDYFY